MDTRVDNKLIDIIESGVCDKEILSDIIKKRINAVGKDGTKLSNNRLNDILEKSKPLQFNNAIIREKTIKAIISCIPTYIIGMLMLSGYIGQSTVYLVLITVPFIFLAFSNLLDLLTLFALISLNSKVAIFLFKHFNIDNDVIAVLLNSEVITYDNLYK